MHDEQLATLPGVQRLHSTLVMKSIEERIATLREAERKLRAKVARPGSR